MILEGKTVIVSGAGPGLGSEVARLALRDGANVVLGSRQAARLEAIAGELEPSGERIDFQATDITDGDQCQGLVDKAVKRFGGVDALAQVAALDTIFGGVQEVTTEDWERSFATNVIGPAQLVRAMVPALQKRDGGAIVLIGSQSSEAPQLPQIAYASAKGALMTAMIYMAKDLGPHRIRVNTVVPTWMWGPPVEIYVKLTAQQQEKTEQQVINGITANMPLGEIPADEDVAEAVVFLCSDRARMITGQSLLVNAGELMR
jgi:NAD(P)-dependent dehydrogenase (short-subunit alcohol dehydrogenase family)